MLLPFVTYLRVIIFLQQTRAPIQCHSRNLVHQTIAMVKFYSPANSFNLLMSSFGPKISFILAVKLRIKSFKVLELLVEIPESATVGSLKVCAGHFSIMCKKVAGFFCSRDFPVV